MCGSNWLPAIVLCTRMIIFEDHIYIISSLLKISVLQKGSGLYSYTTQTLHENQVMNILSDLPSICICKVLEITVYAI